MRLRGLLRLCCSVSRRRRRRSRRGSASCTSSGANDARTAVRARSATPGLVEAEQVGGDLVLAVERGAEHRRVVGVDRDGHAGVAERPDRVLLERGDRAGGDVGRRADLERDAGLGQVREQRRVLGRRGAVADPLGAAAGVSASQTVCGPVVSPACGTLCSPAARAARSAAGTAAAARRSPGRRGRSRPARRAGGSARSRASRRRPGTPNSPGMS